MDQEKAPNPKPTPTKHVLELPNRLSCPIHKLVQGKTGLTAHLGIKHNLPAIAPHALEVGQTFDRSPGIAIESAGHTVTTNRRNSLPLVELADLFNQLFEFPASQSSARWVD